jgi:hypothetical protein
MSDNTGDDLRRDLNDTDQDYIRREGNDLTDDPEWWRGANAAGVVNHDNNAANPAGAGWDDLLAESIKSHAFAIGALCGYKAKIDSLLDQNAEGSPFSISVSVIP